MGYIDLGKEDGATLHLFSTRSGSSGYLIQPTIFTNARPDMKIVREEIFEPVGVVNPFSSEEDVVQQAKNTNFGLAAAVFSKDIDRTLRVANKLQAVTLWVNVTLALNIQVPFGGYKQSGIGREDGEYTLEKYVHSNNI